MSFAVCVFAANRSEFEGCSATSYLGLDVGNSRLSAAIVSRDGRVTELARADAPADAPRAMQRLLGIADEVMASAGGTPEAVGIGFGGPVDVRSGRVRTSFLSSGWEGVAIGEEVARELGLTSFMLNDADAGGLGEALFGAGRGAGSVLYVNVGTGVGGAVILDGRVRTGATSSAGEIGHMVVMPDGPRCECGKRGCLQALSSGTAIARRAAELLQEEGAGGVLADVPSRELTGRMVGEAATDGDALAGRVIAEAAGWLGLAVANAVVLIDPDAVVIGGGVAELGEPLLRPVRERFVESVLEPQRRTPIEAAALGYDAGVIGAAAAAMTEQGARSDP